MMPQSPTKEQIRISVAVPALQKESVNVTCTEDPRFDVFDAL